MARTIDEKVVEMRFDNRDFESNVSQSMSTLDKLKSALNFDGVEKAFSGISSAADKVNLHGMSDALDGLGNKFSALETIAVGALMNIGAAASSYVIDKLKEVSIDQVTEGFSKYGEKTTAVQTIMNATGRSIDDVSEKLKTLNWFTDETSYNFTDMTNSIGKFTSQGVELEDAVAAMEGISTAAALAGQNAQSASRVMYNFSQALGMGAVKLEDWKSVEGANMATEEFKQTIIDTAVELGKLDKYGNILQNTASNYSGDNFVNVGNFRTTLAAGWFDTDVLIKAMNKFGGFAGRLNEVYDVFNENYDVTTSQILKWIKQYEDGTLEIEEVVKKTGLAAEEILPYLSELSSEEYELGRRAFAAAQEAKTFEDVVNATKDAVSTGWMNVFEQIFGNYEEAKTMWTELSNELWDIFAGPVSSLNDLLTDWNNIETPDGLNGRGLLIQSFKDLYHAARNIIDPITEAWEAIFPPIDGQQLFDLTASFQAFTEGLQISEETMARIGEAFEKIFGAIKFVTDGIKSLSSAFTDSLFGEMGDGFGKGILIAIEDISDGIDAFIQKLKGISAVYEIFDETGRAGGKLEKLKEAYPVLYGLVDIFHKLRESLSSIGEYFGKLLSLNEYFVYFGEAGEGIAGIVNIIAFSIRDLLNLITDLVKTWTGIDLTEPFDKAWEVILKFERTIESLQADGVFDHIKDQFFGLFETFTDRFGSFIDWVKPFGEALGSIWDSFFEGIDYLLGGGGEFGRAKSSIFVTISDGLESINEFIENSPLLGSMMNGLKGIIQDISDFLVKFLSFSDIVQHFSFFKEFQGTASGVIAVLSRELRLVLDLIADIIQRVTGIDLHGFAEEVGDGFGLICDFILTAIRYVKDFANVFKKDVKISEQLDTIKDKFFDIFRTFEERFGSIISWIQPLGKIFSQIWDDMFGGISLMIGDKGEGITGFFNAIGEGFDSVNDFVKNSKTLGTVIEGLKGIIHDVSDFLTKFLSFKDAVRVFKDAGGGLSGIASVITDRLGDVLDLIADIIQRVTGIDLHGFGNIVTLMFGGILTAVTKVIGAVKSFFDLFKKESTKDLDEFGEKTEKKFSPIRSLFEGLKSVFEGIWNILKQLSPVFGTITGKIGEAFGKLGEGLKNADLNKFFDVANKGLGLAFGAGIVKFVHSLSKPFGETKGLFDSLKGIIDQITDVLDGVKNALKAWQNDLNAKALLKIAAAIGIITLSVIGLSTIDPGKLGSSIAAITLLFSELIGAMTANNKLNANAKGSNMNKIGIAMIEMAASVLIMSNALKKVAELDWDEILKGVVGLGIVLAEMTLAINNMPKDKVKGGFVMIEMAAALLIAANALKQIGELSWGEIAKGLVGMGIALAEMTAALAILGNFGGSTFGKGLELILVAASLKIIASALTDFGSMQWDEIARGLVAMGGALLEVSGTLLLIGNLGQKILSTSISLVIVGAALKIIASAVTDFGSMQWDEIARGLVAMGGALLEISAVLIILGSLAQNALANSAALVLVGVSLNIIADALKNFAGLEWEEIAKGLIAMGGALFEIVAALLLMGNGGGLAGAAAMIVVAAALAMLAPVLQSLGEMSLAEIGKSLLELAGVFAIIGVAGLLLGPISPMILALAGAVALLGIGVTGIGAGLLMFSAGLTALAAAGTGAIELLVTAIKEILNLIPLLLTKVGEGIVALITVIGESATTIAKEVVKVASAILDAAGVLIPKLVELVVTIIDEVLKTIATHSGSIIESCATILLELLNGIATYLPDFIQAGVNIVLSLIEGLGQGIVDNAERAREAFTNLFKGIVEAILIFLGVDKDKAEEFVNIAGDMINGLTSGIAEFAMNAFLAIGEFMTNLVEKVKEKLPEFIDRGKEIIDNLKEGFTSKVEEAVEALKTVVGKIIDGAKSVVSKAKDLGKSIINKIKGGTEEPESKETAQNVGKSVGDNVAKGLEKSSDTTIRKAAKKVINQAVNSMKQEAAISSPSEVTREEVGQHLGAGIASGLFDSVPDCEAKAKDLVSRVTGTMKKEDFLKEAEDAGFNIGAGYFDGLFQNEEDISEIGGDFVTTFAESAVSNKTAAYDAGTDVGGSICNGLVSQYGSMVSAGEYDASGAIAGISSYAEGGDNAWYTQDVTTDFVTTVADGMISNADLVEGAGRTMAEAAQDGFLGAGWNEFQQKAFEPFKEAFEGISGYASDPWFVMNNDQLDEYTSNLKKRLDGLSDTTSSVTRVVQYGDMQLASDELEAYQMSLDPSSTRAFGYLMNGFDAEAKASQIQTQLEEERQARYDAEAKLNEQSSHGERWLEAINGNIEDLKNKNTDIYLDTGVLAGGTYQKTDELMGTRWAMSRRGV